VLGFTRQLRQIDERLQRLETLYIVRDPGNAVSADAYDGLRKRIAAAAKSHEHHLADVAQLHRTAVTSGSLDVVLTELGDAMTRVGLRRVESPAELPPGIGESEAFDIDGAGSELAVSTAAYVEVGPRDDPGAKGRVHIRGRATRRPPDQADAKPAGSSDTGTERSWDAQGAPSREADMGGAQ
jgi:hypothetical protein